MPSSGFSFTKEMRLRKSAEYKEVYEDGKRIRGAGFSLIMKLNGTAENRLGISISGIKGAVRRNRIKRLLREVFRLHRALPGVPAPVDSLACGMDVIIAVREDFRVDSLAEAEKVLSVAVKQRIASLFPQYDIACIMCNEKE